MSDSHSIVQHHPEALSSSTIEGCEPWIAPELTTLSMSETRNTIGDIDDGPTGWES